MKVNLYKIDEAEFDIKESKSSRIPFDVFCKMGNIDLKKANGNTYPSARFFSNIDEFKVAAEKNHNQFDKTKDIYVMSNGKICVLLNEYASCDAVVAEDKEEGDNGTTDTEENKG